VKYFPLFELLGILFIILKLCGVIAWSWWWIISPFLLLMGAGFIIGALVTIAGIEQGKTQG